MTAGAGRGRLLSMPGKQKNTATSDLPAVALAKAGAAPDMGTPGSAAWGLR